MSTPVLHLHLDESGGFEGARRDETMVMAVLSRWGDRPNAGELAALWRDEWGASAPSMSKFHATDFPDKAVLDEVSARLAARWVTRAGIFVVTCAHRVEDSTPPHCVEMFLEAATSAALAAVDARTGFLPPLAVRVELAYRDGFNTGAAEREICRRLVAGLRSKHGGASVSVNIWLLDVNRSAFLTFSDVLSNVVYRRMRGGSFVPFGSHVALHPAGEWRLSPERLEHLRGSDTPPPAELGLATAPSTTRATLTDLYLELTAPEAVDAEAWIAAHAPDPSALQPDERAATVEDILLMGELLVESRRAWEPARRALALARDLSWHPAWNEGWTVLLDDRVDLRLDSLALVIANHEGGAETTDLDLLRSRARAARLMAAEADTERVLVHHNREVIGLTNTFRFDDAHAHLAPVLSWLEDRSARSPFGARSVQLGQYLGTAGQIYALRAHALHDPGLLDLAQRCFEAAREQDDDPAHLQRQETYLLHLLAERVRLAAPGGTAKEAIAAADHLKTPASALARLLGAPTAGRSVGDAFTVHAWAKLAVLTGRPMPEAATLAPHFAAELPGAHPWPLLASWLLPLADSSRPSWRFDKVELDLKLRKRAAQPDLVGFMVAALRMDPSPAAATQIAGRVPASIGEGWLAGGYPDRLASCGMGTLRATHLLPFNFC